MMSNTNEPMEDDTWSEAEHDRLTREVAQSIEAVRSSDDYLAARVILDVTAKAEASAAAWVAAEAEVERAVEAWDAAEAKDEAAAWEEVIASRRAAEAARAAAEAAAEAARNAEAAAGIWRKSKGDEHD